ncbi:putative triacylglycerol lipase [Helianthus annuus]|uniref:Putative GDSL-like Lipase/Acylhydrolase family protein n=2 Tax=Helianthus annuus TaxID=4232 RepID=A0A251U6J1_HELAN|nr:putative triacylglycerol lipase [Helianthus annuus]KAJ0539337.1 putative triacylglycerol lipase [Helianthus annuus]KAJ0547452.1 putative triacylglycerol lipase [Helianthus annuus]KAJ0554000.1 putative triacylglycerol lipase [Helianthus annuus]KAJ0719635.1 putative triacylglycerol lipase [Helianthus annuus]
MKSFHFQNILPTQMFHLCFLFLLLSPVKSNGETITTFPAILIFGDSTVDTGNNNYITTAVKANHYPYGKDFPAHFPTGRFSNGKLTVDFLASMLGVKESIPPFLYPGLSTYELVTGVSFASAGTGYDTLTTAITRVLPMSKQVEYFKSYSERLKKIVGEKEARRIINRALVAVSAGTNDFIFNFYDVPTRQAEFNIYNYQEFILERLHDFVKELHTLGCRTMLIAGLPPIGCLPIQITAKFKELDRKCISQQNVEAQAYNKRLKELTFQIQMSLKGSRIFYVDIYKPIMDMIRSPEIHGFTETVKGCCGTGLLEAGPICTPLTPLCQNSSEYLFFDSIHPSEKAYRYVTECLMKEIIDKL